MSVTDSGLADGLIEMATNPETIVKGVAYGTINGWHLIGPSR